MTKRPISQDHRDRMNDRRKSRAAFYQQAQRKPQAVRANLSRRHPDHGLSPQEHEAAKAARLAAPKKRGRK